MLVILTLKMLMKIVEKGEHGINMCCMMVFYTVLTSCVPTSSICLLLLSKAHRGGLMGHFGVKKTEDVLATHFKAKDEARRGALRVTMHYLQQS
jgi:hypothetical protein